MDKETLVYSCNGVLVNSQKEWVLIHYLGDSQGKQFPKWKKNWQFFKIISIDLPYDLEVPLLGNYPKEMKTYVHRNLYANIQSSITYNSKKVETIQMCINGCVDKQNMVYSYNGI